MRTLYGLIFSTSLRTLHKIRHCVEWERAKLGKKMGKNMYESQEADDSDGISQLSLPEIVGGWLAKVAFDHVYKCLAHSQSHDYDIITTSEGSATTNFLNQTDSRAITFRGRTTTNVAVTVTIVVRPGNLRAGFVDSCAGPRYDLAVACTCDQFANYGGTPCRHCIWTLFHLANNSKFNSATKVHIPFVSSISEIG